MLNRTQKITALLLGAASAVSLLPTAAIGADKLDILGGSINNAVAFKEGKFYIDGEPEDKEEDVYYLSKNSYSKLKDLDVNSEISLYGSKYVNIDDGDYFLDLSTGKTDDKDMEEEDADDASNNLRKKVKEDNDKRYAENDSKNYKTLSVVPGNKFAEPYYKTAYTPYEVETALNGGASELTVYTDGNGKYIDADYNIGTLRVKLENRKSAKITNTNKSDNGIRASVSNIKEIGQDSSNIYRLADITINALEADSPVAEINGLELEDKSELFEIDNDGKKVTFRALQKISKTQASDDIDGIKYAKTVGTYFLSDADGDVIELLDENNFSVADGKILCYAINGSDLSVQSLELKSKGSVYYLDEDEGDELDLSDEENSVDVDVNGNLWALSDGYLYEFDNKGTWNKIKKIDSDLTSLSVYNKDNIIIWNPDEDGYSVIGNSSSTSEDKSSNDNKADADTNTNAAANNTTVSKQGWQFENNCWYYYSNNTKVTGWYKDGTAWYYMDGNGVMQTGWIKYNNTWYYLYESGAMATGWINDGGTWYYLNSAGAMLSNTTVNGYRLGPSGAWIK